MKRVFLFLTTGFEEIEALATVDILRRAEIDVSTVSITGRSVVVGSHSVPVTADVLFEDAAFETAEMLVIPGGTPAFNDHAGLKRLIADFYDRGEKVAAICASPMVLGGLGILKGRQATCYPGFEEYLKGAVLDTSRSVVIDGNVITGKGPGATIEFALTLVEILAGKERRAQVASQLSPE